jgi:hypothetical protein
MLASHARHSSTPGPHGPISLKALRNFLNFIFVTLFVTAGRRSAGILVTDAKAGERRSRVMRPSTLVGRPGLRDPGVHVDPREGGTDVQTGGALQGAHTIPPRGRLSALLAVVAVLAIAAFMALVVWAGPLSFGGAETREAVPAAGAGTAVVHDDAGSANRGLAPGYAPIHDDAGNLGAGLAPGYVPVHDDAGSVNRGLAPGYAPVHDDAGYANR